MKSHLFGAALAALALFVTPMAIAQDQPAAQTAQTAAAVPPEVQTYLQANPSLQDMTPQQLQQRMRQGRTYMNIQGLPKNLRNRVAQQVRQAKLELDSRRGTAAQANKPAAGQQTAGQANTAQPTNKQVAQTGQQATQGQAPAAGQQQAGGNAPAATAYVNDTTDLKSLQDKEIARRIQIGRRFMTDKSLPAQLRRGAANKIKALRAELQSRKGQGQQGNKIGTTPDAGAAVKVPNNTAQSNDQTMQGGANSAEAERIAKALVNDDRPAKKLSNDDLRTRLNAMRAALAGKNLSNPTERALRQKLASDRVELRQRVDQSPGSNQEQPRPSGGWLEDRRPSASLTVPQLRARIVDLRDAVGNNKFNDNQRNAFKAMLVADRQELNRRELAAKIDRQNQLKRYRDKSNVNIAINIINRPPQERPPGYLPPPVWAAEADEDMIENQLIAPPVRTPPRRYTIEQIEQQPEIRQSMPAVELDTINFAFGESQVREEELDHLDKIGEALEKILAAHPNEVFLIEGHTDAVGSDAANLALSKDRAEAVKQALTEYYNIEPQNLKTIGYGERYLKIATEEEEPENRRVTVRRVTPLVGELEG